MSTISEVSFENINNCIYQNIDKDTIRLYTLFKTNCKIVNNDTITEKLIKEMKLLKIFLDTNNIVFPIKKNTIESIKKKLLKFQKENNMDIILIFLDATNISATFVSEPDNNKIIEGMKKLLFNLDNNKIIYHIKM